MKRRSIYFLSAIAGSMLSLASMTTAGAVTPSGESAFNSLKALSGSWMGKDEDGQPITATYEVSSGGTIVVETLKPGIHPPMMTVYYRDGDGLMMTHYCNMNNQPRMRLQKFDPSTQMLDFDFVDITNLKNDRDGHIRKLTMSINDSSHMKHDWTYRSDGKEAHAVFVFEREALPARKKAAADEPSETGKKKAAKAKN